MVYCTQQEVRDELQTDIGTHSDALVNSWIAAAQAVIDFELNSTWDGKLPTTDKFTLESSGTNSATPSFSVHTILWLTKRPEVIGDITEFKVNGVIKTDLAPELFEAGRLRLNLLSYESDIIEVTYNYGIANVPDSIKRLCQVTAANMSRVRDQPAVASTKSGEYSTNFKELNPEIFKEIDKHKGANTISDAVII